jgi:cytochrome c553
MQNSNRPSITLSTFITGLPFVVVLATTSCGSSDGTVSGEVYFSGKESAALGKTGNTANCSTCHGNEVGETGFPGNTMANIAYHTSFKGGGAATLLAGSNACVTGWMGGTALTADSKKWLALEAYLQSISSIEMTTPNAIAPEVLANEAAYATAYAGGSATAGAAKYAKSCGSCHDNAIVVGAAPAISRTIMKSKSIGRIAQQVRTAGPPPSGTSDAADSTPGPMAFFEPKDLSAQDLKDIIAFVKQ